jgi:O-antigen/teichoic acid export membrane protein
VLRRALAFVATVSIARYLPVETFGRYVLVLATIELFRQVADFGIDYIAVRRLARDPGAGVLRPALRLKLAMSLVAVACAEVFALAMGYGPQFMGYLALASLALLFSATASTLATSFQATLSMRRLVPVNATANLLMLALVWAGILFHVSVAGFLLAAALAEAYGLALTFLLLRRAGHRAQRVAPVWVPARGLLAEAAPLGLASVLVMMYFRLDTIVLSKVAGETEVGRYGAIFRLTEGSLALAAGLAATFLPLLSTYLANPDSRQRGLELYERGFNVLLASSVLLASTITLLAGPIMRLLYGAPYADAAPGLAVLIWSTVFMSLNMMQTSAFVALGRQRALFGVTIVNLLINVALIVTLIPRFGLLGACAATVVTEAANTLIQSALLARDLPMSRMLVPVLRYGGLAVLALGLALALGRSVPASAALGGALAAYALALLALEVRSVGGGLMRRRLPPLVTALASRAEEAA